MRDGYERQLARAAEDKRLALERQLAELTGTAEDAAEAIVEREREARIELLRRQIARRLLHSNLVRGYAIRAPRKP